MFTTTLGSLKDWFGKAFVLAVWLPVFVFASAALTVYLAGAGRLSSFADAWAQWRADEKLILSAEFLLAVTLVAYALDFAQVSIARVFEGYWSGLPLLRSFARLRTRRYERAVATLAKRLDELSETIPAEEDEGRALQLKEEMNRLEAQRLHGFPPPGFEAHLMPTRLGNIYKEAELYPLARYNIDSVIVWPRLLEVLPDKFVGRLQEVKTAVDFLLLFSLLSALFAVLSVPYLLAQGARPALLIACASGLPLAWLSYRAALSPALAYAELVKVAFDLYRKTLLKTMGLPAPADLGDEKALWGEVSDFIFRGIPPARNFQPDAPSSE